MRLQLDPPDSFQARYLRHRFGSWNTTCTCMHLCSFLLVLVMHTVNLAQAQTSEVLGHVRLIDRLDRPEDGYCLDIPGVGQNLQLDVPLFAHNCKPDLTTDSAIFMPADGTIRFVAPNVCVTVAGVNSTALPKASILLRPCGGQASFFGDSRMQRFEFRDDNRLQLVDFELCLTVGAQSERTFSPFDRWRTLFVEACELAEPALSQWEFVVPD